MADARLQRFWGRNPASRLRTQGARPGERVEAVARKLPGRHVIADVTCIHGLGQEAFDQLAQVMLGAEDLMVAM